MVRLLRAAQASEVTKAANANTFASIDVRVKRIWFDYGEILPDGFVPTPAALAPYAGTGREDFFLLVGGSHVSKVLLASAWRGEIHSWDGDDL